MPTEVIRELTVLFRCVDCGGKIGFSSFGNVWQRIRIMKQRVGGTGGFVCRDCQIRRVVNKFHPI